MIANVLVPLDGTVLAEQAIATAISLVRRRHGHLELMLVRDAHQRLELEEWPWAIPTPQTTEEYVADQAIRCAESASSYVGHVTVDGRVPAEICRRAGEIRADLIVMATHGRTGLARTLAGSVSHDVIRHTNVPVLLLRAPAPGRRLRRTPLHLRRILIPVEDAAASAAVFDAVEGLLEPGATEVLLLQVVEPVRTSHAISLGYVAGAVDRPATDALTDAARSTLAALTETLGARFSCDVIPHVAVDDRVARGIVRFAERFNVSLIAMATHARGASRYVLGSVTDGVIRESRLPLLVVRPPHDAQHSRTRSHS